MRAVMFDLDGVLIDSWHVAEGAFLETSAMLGFDGPSRIEAFRQRLGMPIGCIGTELDLPEGFAAAFIAAARRLDHRAAPFDGVATLLSTLKADGWRIGVVTGKDAARAGDILDRTGLGGYVDALVGGDTAPRGKPNPDPLWMCEAMLATDGAEGYVGDTAIDGEAARRAGRTFFHAVWGTQQLPGAGKGAGDGAPRRFGEAATQPPGSAAIVVKSADELLSLLCGPSRAERHG